MTSVNFIPISALQPVELHYQYNKNEILNSELVSYVEGFNFYQIDGLNNYQDVTINSNSCLLLTDTVKLSSLFRGDVPIKKSIDTSVPIVNIINTEIYYGRTPGTINLQKRGDNTHYVYYNNNTNSFYLDTKYSNIFINPIANSNEVQLLVNNMYLQVDASYPYQLRASSTPLLGDEGYRQQFTIVELQGEIMIKTMTVDGPRYLALSNNSSTFNTIYATGCIIGNNILNDYIFVVNDITSNIDSAPSYGHITNNNWVTYHMDNQSQVENKTVTINNVIQDQGINYLIDFPYQNAIDTGKAYINVANLKTYYTPTGTPAPVSNL
jgi:hypothetical protein